MTPEQIYGRRAVREALRGPREVLELWATERALGAEPWLQENGGPRVRVKLERELSETVGTRDHQGVVAKVAPYQYADAYQLAQEPSPLLVCLDRVTDPRNLGAVARSVDSGDVRLLPVVHGNGAGASNRNAGLDRQDRKSTRLNSSHVSLSRMPSSA